MNEILSLTSLTREELLGKMAYAVESLQEYEIDNGDSEYLYESIANIMYVLKNCDYKGRE